MKDSSIKLDTTVFNKWQSYYYELNNELLSKLQIGNSLNVLFSRFKELTSSTVTDLAVSIQFKVKINDNIRSVSYLQTISLSKAEAVEDLIEVFNEFLGLRDQDYILSNPSHIIYTYKLIDPSPIIIKEKINRSIAIKKDSHSFNFKGFNLCTTMDFSLWGEVLYATDRLVKVKKNQL